MTKDNKGFRPMSDDENDMMSKGGKTPNSGMMPEEYTKPNTGKLPNYGMMPETGTLKGGKAPNSGNMPENATMPKSMKAPNSGMMPETGVMPSENMAPKHPVNAGNMNKVQGEEAHYKALYPEVFYKVQPYVLMVCDELENMGEFSPNQETMDNIADNIYGDIREMYPEMSDYIEQADAQQTVVLGYGGRFGRPFRRRGMFRDLIGIMLLGELYGRRRRRYW